MTSNQHEVFLAQLGVMVWAESTLSLLYQELVDASYNEGLSTLLANHLTETERHADNVEQALNVLGSEERGESMVVGAIADEARINLAGAASVRATDFAILEAFVKAEGFEVAVYRWLFTYLQTAELSVELTDLITVNFREDEIAHRRAGFLIPTLIHAEEPEPEPETEATA
jgi:ferritin-like metal-binding protein YciE